MCPGRRLATVLLAACLLSMADIDGGAALDPQEDANAPIPRAATGTGPGLSRVYPNAARDDEFVEVRNYGPREVDLTGWSLDDGEGCVVFPAGTRLGPGGAIVAARNSTSYAEDLMAPADFTWDLGDRSRMEGVPLRLGDGGDEVLLRDAAGAVADAFIYGASEYAGAGWTGRPAVAPGRGHVAVRGTDGDHDDASDWERMRAARIGQSAFDPPAVVLDGPARVLVSPEDGAAPLLALLGSAGETVDLAVYTLTSRPVGAVLAELARRGVRVRLLLESSPVGGLDDDGRTIAAGLAAQGAEVRWLSAGETVVKRYAYLHAKYAVLDGETVLVSSENFGDAGFPEDGRSGNRGWSVAIRDPELAGQLRDVFDEDFDPARRDTIAALPDSAADLGPSPALDAWTWPAVECCRAARLLVGPDNVLEADGLPGLLDGARERAWIEAFYLEDPWGPWPNPLLEAAFRAAGRGVDVRILLDGGAWYADPEVGNAAIAAAVNARATAAGVPLSARLLARGGRVETLHNKGAVVDGRVALFSSVNWAWGSATENREVAIVLEDRAIAARLERAFLQDWGDPLPDTSGLALLDQPAALLLLYAAVAASSALSLRFLRPGDKGLRALAGLKPRGPGRTRLRCGRREVRLLPFELVAEPRARARGGGRNRRGRGEARCRLRGPEGD